MTIAAKALSSFIEVHASSNFPIQNLPYGVFKSHNNSLPHVCTAIGNMVLDLTILEKKGIFAIHSKRDLFSDGNLNGLMSSGKEIWAQARSQITELLSSDNPTIRDSIELRNECLIPASQVEMLLPVEIGDYTDFYSSEDHARNVGKLFRDKDNPLLPNWKHMPIAYNGRASSVIVSGTPITRPTGQIKVYPDKPPIYSATKKLDFELEVGFFIGQGNKLGQPIAIHESKNHIFGFVLVNDWSARDIQQWEYQPLGPFLGKIFATSISPWVIPIAALEPFRVKMPTQEPNPVDYLHQTERYTYDIHLEVRLKPTGSTIETIICQNNFQNLYWSIDQQLAHHTISGCNMRTGDLLASGSISGPTQESCGSLLELTKNGEIPLKLPTSNTHTFLEDGDAVIMTGWCQGDGYRIGFGNIEGVIQPAMAYNSTPEASVVY